jgi:hypothetical protein
VNVAQERPNRVLNYARPVLLEKQMSCPSEEIRHHDTTHGNPKALLKESNHHANKANARSRVVQAPCARVGVSFQVVTPELRKRHFALPVEALNQNGLSALNGATSGGTILASK